MLLKYHVAEDFKVTFFSSSLKKIANIDRQAVSQSIRSLFKRHTIESEIIRGRNPTKLQEVVSALDSRTAVSVDPLLDF